MTNKEYYGTLKKLFIPLLITYLLTNSFSLIDSAMLSWYGNDYAIGVSTAIYLQAIIGPILFGLLAGVGIYGSQYFGAKDYDNLKKAFGLSLLVSMLFGIIFFFFISFFGNWFIGLYDLESTTVVTSAKEYMAFIKYFYLIFPINFAFTFGFRITKRAKFAMYTNIAKGALNVIFNWVLIFGNLGFKEMGVEGAIIATLLSQGVVLIITAIIVVVTKPEFFGTFRQMFNFDFKFAKPILLRAIPIVISEALFGTARFAYTYAFAQISDVAFAADIYATKLLFMMGSFTMACANTCSIMIGSELGNGDMDRVRDVSKRLFRFMMQISLFVLIVSAVVGPMLVQPLFQIEDPELLRNVRLLTIVGAVFTSLRVMSSSILFVLRSGGDTLFALIVDSGMAWMVGVPITLFVAITFNVSPFTLKIVTLSESFSKTGLALYRFKSNKWMNNLVESNKGVNN